ncbi:hypothetical protein Tco_1241064, partial [Tanacetum coccineum]
MFITVAPHQREKGMILWFKDKVLVVQAQARVSNFTLRMNSHFLPESRNSEGLATIVCHNSQLTAYQDVDLDADVFLWYTINDNVNSDMTIKLCRAKPSSNTVQMFSKSFLSEKAQQLEPMLCVGDIIQKTNRIVIPDSEETLTLAEESHFKTRFVPQTELFAEQAFWLHNSVSSSDSHLSDRPTNVEVPKELLKVSMVNTSLKKLKYHLANFDVVVKERTMSTAITEGTWGFKHTK